MLTAETSLVLDDVDVLLDRLAVAGETQSNCMFQLSLMLARIAIEPCCDDYKAEAVQALMQVIRAKPRSNVVRLFGGKQNVDITGSGLGDAR